MNSTLLACLEDALRFLWFAPLERGSAADSTVNDALIVIATVSVVAWTGGFLIKPKKPKDITFEFLFGMDQLQTAFVGPIVVLITDPIGLRALAAAFFALALFRAIQGARYSIASFGERWVRGKAFELSCIGIVLIFPDRYVAALLSALAMYVGYQSLLPPFYRAIASAEGTGTSGPPSKPEPAQAEVP